MKRFAGASLVVGIVFLVGVSHALAFEGGGRKPSEAPLIAFGQHYTGQLNNHKDDANYNGRAEVAIWRLPPVSTRDQVVVNWHVLPFTKSSGYPVCMTLVQGVDDFTWGTVFGNSAPHYYNCSESGPNYRVSGSGSAQTAITVQNTDTSSSYLEFFSDAETETPTLLETYPYDFTVEAPRHFLGLAVVPKAKVHANGAIRAAVTLANGLPAPDGISFGMTVTWGEDGVATYAASTVGGQLVFPLALPESAVHERAAFTIAHGTDSAFQATGGTIRAQVTPAKATAAEIACLAAVRRAHVLARQHARLQRHAAHAGGIARRHLRHRAHRVGRALRSARAEVQTACAGL